MPESINDPKISGDMEPKTPDSQKPAELHWLSILDLIPDAISIHSTTGEILWANSKLCEQDGRSLSELQGLSCEKAFHGYWTSCPHDEVVANGHRAQVDSEMDSSGSTLSMTIQPIFDQGKVSGFVRLVRDATDQYGSREQLLKMERFATLGQAFSGIAHDVGTPLNIISGYSEFLLMRVKPEDRGYKELSAILNQTKRIAALFGEALDLARPPQHRADPIQMKSVLENSLNLAGHFLRKADVKAELTCRKALPLIYGESSQLTQAFLNLLLKAGERVERGGQLEVVLDEWPDKPGFLTLELYGTMADGSGHDFHGSLGHGLESNQKIGTQEPGLLLVREIFEEIGAEIAFREAGERGVSLVINLRAGKQPPPADADSSK